jgi:hypothetical protein
LLRLFKVSNVTMGGCDVFFDLDMNFNVKILGTTFRMRL